MPADWTERTMDSANAMVPSCLGACVCLAAGVPRAPLEHRQLIQGGRTQFTMEIHSLCFLWWETAGSGMVAMVPSLLCTQSWEQGSEVHVFPQGVYAPGMKGKAELRTATEPSLLLHECQVYRKAGRGGLLRRLR